MLSEMKDQYRGLKTPPLAPPEIEVKAPDPEYIFDVSPVLSFNYYKHRIIRPPLVTFAESRWIYVAENRYKWKFKAHVP